MRKLLSLAACFALAACSDDSSGVDAPDTSSTDHSDSDTSNSTDDPDTSEDISEDTSPPTPDVPTPGSDTSSDTSDIIEPREFGAPCSGNADCNSGYCVEGPEGYICTRSCSQQCDDGFDCKSVQNSVGDVLFLCMPRVLKLCTPCLEDFQCNGGACLQIDGSGQCASHCSSDDECLEGYACRPDATGSREGNYCQPKSGSCECSPPYAGVARACTRTNSLGTCIGVETCDPDVGWVGCTAREAAPETCDYVDNDCDNSIDEDFKTDGLYAETNACGSCNTSCDELLANTVETTCAIVDGAARCQVVTCAPGYSQLNDYVCVPDAGNVCTPCTDTAECVGNGAACTQLTDGKFCTRACGNDSDCATGFVCSAEHGNQCVPESGSCTCDGSNTDLARSCEVTYTPPNSNDPAITCRGLEACTAEGWGGCTLPAEECDGVDNDCDGVVDGPFKTGDSYTHINHCGACGNSCLAFARPNAAPICDTNGVVPTCGYACVGNAVDVNGRSDDGCECVPVAGPDLAGDSLDSNCDGVDGEVDNAIFVSRDGADTNPGTREAPMLTIQAAITRASQENKRDVYVATGVYSESIELRDGVGVFGGYSPYFDTHDVLLYETALIGLAPTTQRPGTVNARDLGQSGASRNTVLDGFSVFGTNAANTVGESSYGVYLMNVGGKLRVSNNRVYANAGGNGQTGNSGTNGLNGTDGAIGANAYDINASSCTTQHHRSGGAGGIRMCGSVDVSGGNGGTSTCPTRTENPNHDSRKGNPGKGPLAGLGGSFGYDMGWGNNVNNSGCSCYVPVGNQTYTPGSGFSAVAPPAGSSGTAAGATGSVVSGLWRGAAGGDGGAGTHGSGGGGGGAGAGVALINTCGSGGYADVGGSGGGGGSGGCAGAGGTGGTAGGGSFGIFLFNATSATPVLTNNVISNGRGGNGGAGGAGGVGGVGGKGANGGASGDTYTGDAYAKTWCAAGGGVGGNGSDGGHGGGGGGGAGGVSYGIYAQISGTPPADWKTGNTFLGGGAGGNGGAGGVSVSTGASGQVGANGANANTNF